MTRIRTFAQANGTSVFLNLQGIVCLSSAAGIDSRFGSPYEAAASVEDIDTRTALLNQLRGK